VTSLVVKVGGNVVAGDAMSAIAEGIAALRGRGDRVAMVHGGGPQATALQKRLGQEPNVIGGRRITDADALEVMKMVVGGQLNVDLCAALLAAGARPVGLHGASSLAVEACLRPPRVVSGCGPDPVNFGLVGDVVGFNRELLDLLQSAGYVPVIACLGAQPDGVVLNINADIVANQLAGAIHADHLVLVTSAPGVLRNLDDPTSRIERLTASQARSAIADGTVAGGMIPKLEESIRVLSSGVGSIHIVGDLGPGDLLREIDSPGAVGTALLADRD
jgi:acetylglutamate kinase